MRARFVLTTLFVCTVLGTGFLFSSFVTKARLSTQTDQRRLGRDQETVSEKRIALVIGNGAYSKGPLRNPPNDARAMAAALRELGFETMEVIDADKVKLQRAIRDFGKRLKEKGGVGLFYYAGHGVQVDGHNYIVPLGAETEVEKEEDVELYCLDSEAVLKQMEGAGGRVNIIIMDACRDNPFSRSFSRGGGGLSEIKAPSGTLIAYATDPGKTASDGDGDNGLYTQELLAKMREPGLRIEDVFNLAGAEVERKSKKKQQPWISSKLRGAFYFKPKFEVSPIEFVFIPAGEFLMGLENGEAYEKPVHRVVLTKPFWMGKYEVTQAQWEAAEMTNKSNFDDCPQCPVENVSWEDSQKFIEKLNAKGDGYNYRLPTEAEWEYACRAGTTGDYAGDLDKLGWHGGNSGDKTHPVGQKNANAFGLYDMHGNVWEWCQDWYGDYPSISATDPTGPTTGLSRVFRGGCWYGTAEGCRSANRYYESPARRNISFGFRLVRMQK